MAVTLAQSVQAHPSESPEVQALIDTFVRSTMKVVRKYPLHVCPIDNQIALPVNAKVLSVQVQNNEGVLYALLDQDADIPNVTRTFICIATGEPFKETLTGQRYVGALMLDGDASVFHVFEVVGG